MPDETDTNIEGDGTVSMTVDEIEAFLGEQRNIIVCALRKDGRPQMSPTWFVWDGNRFIVSMTKNTHKYRNITRDPRVQLLIDDALAYKSVLVDGKGSFVEDVDAMIPLVRAVRAKHGIEAPDDAAMKDQLTRDGRVVLVVTPDRPISEWTNWS